MRKLYFWLVALLPAAACTHQAESINYSSYTLDGHSERTTAKAYLEPARPDGTDGLLVRVGIPPVGPRREVLYLNYTKPAGTTPLAYQPDYVSLNYTADSVVHGINYNTNLRGTLKQTPGGGYSGTFQATCPGSATRKKSTVKVVFKDVRPTPRPARP